MKPTRAGTRREGTQTMRQRTTQAMVERQISRLGRNLKVEGLTLETYFSQNVIGMREGEAFNGYFGKTFAHGNSTSKRAIYDVLAMVNELIETEVNTREER